MTIEKYENFIDWEGVHWFYILFGCFLLAAGLYLLYTFIGDLLWLT